jgi:type IV secretory pathway TraG/TraD family ATPase VirD4
MMIANIINSLMEPFDPKTEPLIPLVIIDELGALGKISAMEHINMLAGNGCQLMLVCQQLQKLKQIYGEEGVGTILSACETKICFHCDDPYTQAALSDLGGVKGAWVNSWHKVAGTPTKHEHQQSVPLIRPQDIGSLKEGEAFVWMKYAPPVKAYLPGYFDRKAWPDLDGKWDENTTLPMNQRSAA